VTDEIDAADYLAQKPRKRSKYGNEKVWIDGRKFDSKAEGARYWDLCRMQDAGEIRDLECQPSYPLLVQGVKIGEYRADFRYVTKGGTVVVEDVKGVRTAVYVLKKKHVKAQYGIDVREIRP
jgi:hypothetical protein